MKQFSVGITGKSILKSKKGQCDRQRQLSILWYYAVFDGMTEKEKERMFLCMYSSSQ
jgi:hypothetical protein